MIEVQPLAKPIVLARSMHPNVDLKDVQDFMNESGPAKAPAKQVVKSLGDIPTIGNIPNLSVEWLAEGIIPKAAVTLVAAQPGHYKSWLAMCLARAVASGGTFLGKKCEQRPVVYIDRENTAGTVRDRAALLGLLDLPNFH